MTTLHRDERDTHTAQRLSHLSRSRAERQNTQSTRTRSMRKSAQKSTSGVQLKEGLQVNLRRRGRVGQVEVAEHLGVHGAEEADDLAALLQVDLGAPG